MSKKYITLEGLKTFFTKIKDYISKASVSSATKATQDENGINIKDNYARKTGTYSNLTAGNSYKINHLELKRDSNGVLKIGDVIIPQKKLLWTGSVRPEAFASETVIWANTNTYNKYIEIQLENGLSFRMKNYSLIPVNNFNGTTSEIQGIIWYRFLNVSDDITVTVYKQGTIPISNAIEIVAIYEIIE